MKKKSRLQTGNKIGSRHGNGQRDRLILGSIIVGFSEFMTFCVTRKASLSQNFRLEIWRNLSNQPEHWAIKVHYAVYQPLGVVFVLLNSRTGSVVQRPPVHMLFLYSSASLTAPDWFVSRFSDLANRKLSTPMWHDSQLWILTSEVNGTHHWGVCDIFQCFSWMKQRKYSALLIGQHPSVAGVAALCGNQKDKIRKIRQNLFSKCVPISQFAHLPPEESVKTFYAILQNRDRETETQPEPCAGVTADVSSFSAQIESSLVFEKKKKEKRRAKSQLQSSSSCENRCVNPNS